MSDYVFKVGDEGFTRSGRPYRVICVDANHIRPVVVLIRDDNQENAYSRTKEGRCEAVSTWPGDLLPPKRKLECWVNFYNHEEGIRSYTYQSEKDAADYAGRDYRTFLKTVHVVTEV